MITQSTFARKAEAIISHVNEAIPVSNPEKEQDVLPVIRCLHQLFPQWVVMVCPVQHPDLFYVSNNCKQLFGYSDEYMTNNPGDYFRQLHEADIEDLYKCFAFAQQLVEKSPPDDRYKIRLIYHYRFRHKNGGYIVLHDEKAVHQSHDGKLLFYTLFHDITHETIFSGVKVAIYRQGAELEKITEFKPSAAGKMSVREREVFTLIKNGLTTKEIAVQLGISHHTVRNLRSKMFEKYRVSNTIELINAAS